jgi:hypothetical protein
MNHDKFLGILKAGFERTKDPATCGGLVVPASPVSLREACLGAMESDEGRDDFYGGAEKGLLPELGWSFESLISFYWQTGSRWCGRSTCWSCRIPITVPTPFSTETTGSAPVHQEPPRRTKSRPTIERLRAYGSCC